MKMTKTPQPKGLKMSEKPRVVKVDVEPTVAVIMDMAATMERYAAEMKAVARKMLIDGDISRAAEALTSITNCFQNLRLDLLVTRPIREFDRTLYVDLNAEREGAK
jgi:hypothetical protein